MVPGSGPETDNRGLFSDSTTRTHTVTKLIDTNGLGIVEQRLKVVLQHVVPDRAEIGRAHV